MCRPARRRARADGGARRSPPKRAVARGDGCRWRVQGPPLIGYGCTDVAERGGTPDERTGLFALVLLALAVGVLAGAVGAAFRLALAASDGWRNALVAWAQGYSWLGMLLVAGTTAVGAALAAFLVRRFAR